MSRWIHKIAVLTLVFGLCACSSERDLDTICGAFKTLATRSDLVTMTPPDRMRFVQARIEPNLSSLSKVKPLWHTFPASVSDSRYGMFKVGAEELLEREWSCKEMAGLAPTLGK
jgi:hypothetical protein